MIWQITISSVIRTSLSKILMERGYWLFVTNLYELVVLS